MADHVTAAEARGSEAECPDCGCLFLVEEIGSHQANRPAWCTPAGRISDEELHKLQEVRYGWTPVVCDGAWAELLQGRDFRLRLVRDETLERQEETSSTRPTSSDPT